MKSKTKLLITVSIVAAVLVGVMLLLIFLPESDSDEYEIDEGIDMTATVDEAGIHQVTINTDENGEIENNSYGYLLEYDPADISSIHVENTSGSFDVTSYTPVNEDGETDTTEYTLVGFEDFELQSGVPDLIATAVSTVEFSTVISLDGENSSDYGFDEPSATATVTYDDGTAAILTVGDDAPQGAGTYVRFGSGDAVYLVATDDVSALLYSVTDLISLTVNDTPSDSDNLVFSSITLTGTNFPDDIVIVPNDNTNNSATNTLTKPRKCYASESESSSVTGAIRGLYADSVAMVNPSDGQLKNLGLDSPYAKLVGVYPDETVTLIASEPDSDGSVYLMTEGGSVVYRISSSSVPWVTTSFDALMSEYVLYPEMTELSQIKIDNGSDTYTFDLSTSTSTTTDDDGSETSTTTTTIFCGDTEIDSGTFTTFYQNLALIERTDATTDSVSGDVVLSIIYTYSSDDSSDTVVYYNNGNNRYLATLNGSSIGYVYKTYINKLVNQVETISENETVDSFFS